VQDIYYPGDEVAVRLHFQHSGNIERIEAIFAHTEVPSLPTVEFTETRRNPEIYRRPSASDLMAVSEAYLTAEIQPDTRAGTYRCASLVTTLYGGRKIEFATRPGFTFQVAGQPQDAPAIITFEPISVGEAYRF
jgi:hypothetical protein